MSGKKTPDIHEDTSVSLRVVMVCMVALCGGCFWVYRTDSRLGRVERLQIRMAKHMKVPVAETEEPAIIETAHADGK